MRWLRPAESCPHRDMLGLVAQRGHALGASTALLLHCCSIPSQCWAAGMGTTRPLPCCLPCSVLPPPPPQGWAPHFWAERSSHCHLLLLLDRMWLSAVKQHPVCIRLPAKEVNKATQSSRCSSAHKRQLERRDAATRLRSPGWVCVIRRQRQKIFSCHAAFPRLWSARAAWWPAGIDPCA